MEIANLTRYKNEFIASNKEKEMKLFRMEYTK